MLSVCQKYILLLLFLASYKISSFAQVSNLQVDATKLSGYFQNEQYDEAIEYLENKKVSTSKDIGSVNALGYAYFMTENFVLAKQNYSTVLVLDSLNFTANRYSALISNADKDYQQQLFYYLRLLRIQPSNAGLNKLTGDTYTLLKSPDTALLYYSKAYGLQPANTKIVAAYLEKLLDQEAYATVDSVTRSFLIKDTLNVAIIKLAVRSYSIQKKMKEAAAFTDRWLLTGEIDPKTTVSIAQANYAVKQYPNCYKVCKALIEQGIETEALLYYASQAKYKLNDYLKSDELLKQCLNLAISKNTNLYYFSRADNFEALKQYKKAIALYDTAFYLFHDALALYNIGRLYEEGLKNSTIARQFYQKYLVVAKPKTKDEQRVYAYVKQALQSRKEE